MPDRRSDREKTSRTFERNNLFPLVIPPPILGIDIGGANLKYARTDARARAFPFAMWKHPQQVASTITHHIEQHYSDSDLAGVAITITGELADCFADRGEGVQHLVDQAMRSARTLGLEHVLFYGVDGEFHSPTSATQNPDLIAAANWHALATYVANEFTPNGLLIDIGSTTTDIIPIEDGRVATDAKTDHERLAEGSLVYVGCRRTPVCALTQQLTLDGRIVPVMNEWFATIDDAMLVLQQVDEDSENDDTSDGRPRTKLAAANRLARMIGLDHRSVTLSQASQLADQVLYAARDRIAHAVAALDHGQTMVISGHGPGLLNRSHRKTISLPQRLGEDVSRCAPAYAVARLLQSEKATVES